MIHFLKNRLKLRDPVSGLLHLLAALLSIIGAIWLLHGIGINPSRTVWHFLAFSIFGISMFLLYVSSSLYHLLPLSERGVSILRRIDHIMIYIFIAGTYTPICLVALRARNIGEGWGMFATVWALTLCGVALKIFWLESARWIRVALYFSMASLGVVFAPALYRALPTGALVWLLVGAGIYGIGAIVYATKRPNPFPEVFGFHEIWHLFVMAASFCHLCAMKYYISVL